ncbi:phosphotransferase family protein [Guptibacillus sedimenti]|uniref:phosphotransferase family protein n=1 Tax=Guptibacillus sedimenti TaxID=3025680 RepID=UPI00308113C2
MKLLDNILGEGWQVTPAGGATGEAYLAQYGDEKLFLKRNSSPFLAVLSAEGIVPKLLWTKRLENGDVITAQKWLPGRELKSHEMKQPRVAQMLYKIHRSSELRRMLNRLGKKPLSPDVIYQDLLQKFENHHRKDVEVIRALSYLAANKNDLENVEKVVCHCDVNHNNWMFSEEGNLYLIDWDGAVVADPALDIGMLLYWYLPKEEWEEWLTHYGLENTESLRHRMYWYVVAQTLLSIYWYDLKGLNGEVEFWKKDLENLNHYRLIDTDQ